MVLWGVDVQPLVQEVLGYLALVLAVMAVVLVKKGLSWLGIKVDDARFAKLQMAVEKVLQFSAVRIEDEIRARGPTGWSDPDVKDKAVRLSLETIEEKFPEALLRSGLDLSDPTHQDRLRDMMERTLPDVFARLAASPASPPSDQPVAAVVVPGTNPGG